MPAALKVDKEAVKVMVLTFGVRETARKLGLPEPTVQAWSARGKWLEPTRDKPASMPPPASMASATVATTPSQAVKNALDAGENPKILSLLEKREFLAKAVRTPIAEIDENHPLAQKIKRRRDKDGAESEEIESVAKLRALELDAKLAGELEPEKGSDAGLVSVTLVRVELPQASPVQPGPTVIDV